VLSVDAAGQITQLFPNKHEPDSQLKAGVPRTFPPKDTYKITAQKSPGNVPERLLVWSTTGELPSLAELGIAEGDFRAYSDEKAHQGLETALRGVRNSRGLKIESGEIQQSKAEIVYRVK